MAPRRRTSSNQRFARNATLSVTVEDDGPRRGESAAVVGEVGRGGMETVPPALIEGSLLAVAFVRAATSESDAIAEGGAEMRRGTVSDVSLCESVSEGGAGERAAEVPEETLPVDVEGLRGSA